MIKNRKRLIFNLLVFIVMLALVSTILNMPVFSKQGINYHIRIIKMPLYIKILEFIDRDYHYRQMAKLITEECNTDEEKALAIFDWTYRNIRKDIPENWPIVDDHVWNIIIRGYSTCDQSADVFTTLCVYAGIPAFWRWISPKDSDARLAISYVKLNKKWRIFDSYHGNYFWNEKREIASLEDIIANPTLINQCSNTLLFHGVKYIKYFENLSPINNVKFLRAKKQMPLSRFIYELKRIIASHGR
jgi:hypothetical protein